jgi:hypothetical protein
MTLSFQTTTVTRVPLHPLLLLLAVRAEFFPTEEELADGYSDEHLRVSLSGHPALKLLDAPAEDWAVSHTEDNELVVHDYRRGRDWVFFACATRR